MRPSLFRLILRIGIFFFVMTIYPQEASETQDSQVFLYDTLQIKFPKVYWFNSYKFEIGNYAKGRSKSKPTSVSHNSKKGVEEALTTSKFSITLENLDSKTSLIEGEFVRLEHYIVQRENLLENLTGIESESTEMLDLSQQKKGTITSNYPNGEPWEIVLIESTSLDNAKEQIALLRSASRTIELVPISGSTNFIDLGIFTYDQFEFIENGILIGKLDKESGHKIILQKNIDPYTRLIVISAMMFIYG